MLYRQVMVVLSENHMKRKNTLRDNVELFNVKLRVYTVSARL
jgi:hypothetical protein